VPSLRGDSITHAQEQQNTAILQLLSTVEAPGGAGARSHGGSNIPQRFFRKQRRHGEHGIVAGWASSCMLCDMLQCSAIVQQFA
jgi:hypothetical protein